MKGEGIAPRYLDGLLSVDFIVHTLFISNVDDCQSGPVKLTCSYEERQPWNLVVKDVKTSHGEGGGGG